MKHWPITTLLMLLTTLVAGQPQRAQQTVADSGSSTSAGGPDLNRPLRSLTLGGLRVTPTYVDTGPFAAAQEDAYWIPSATQFVVVTAKAESLYNGGEQDPRSLVKLETNTGRVYGPLGADGKHDLTGGRVEVPWPTWVFKVAAGEKPSRLLVANPEPKSIGCPRVPSGLIHRAGGSPETEIPNCRQERDPDWRKLGVNQVPLSLAGLPSRNDLGNFQQRSPAARVGQLEIRVTSVGGGFKGWWGNTPTPWTHGRHVVAISLAVRNVTDDPNCTELNTGLWQLFDNRGYEYSGPVGGRLYDSAQRLLPGETLGANVTFEAYDGTAPRILVIRRNFMLERDCAERQHRPLDMHGGSTVRIPVRGIPVIAAPATR